ncbi:hypothetical protein EUGRSUZ_H01226 [Eucalyptus grandis]|uniref:Uncharacterized protein n=2 Tax=Eucalyptus grandis TaxID=71139 RepID=A0ACC3JNN7_EUCGR|nr:hypothetical protein EUGRSUZ_H01226 [Eucalyptus grandis]
MANIEENHLRLAALCRQMEDLWSEEDITDLGDNIPEEEQKQNELTLYGKLYSKPNVNFQAFCSTMKRAWKIDTVKCEQIAPGYFSFMFQSSEEKRRVIEIGPWSFASNLLVLREGDPSIPEHCYEFTHYAFWVHFIGLPRARVNEESIRLLASRMGRVEEIKIEARGNNSRKIGKARVVLNLAKPLKIGTIINCGDKKWWIDYKYERLPHYCYSYGRIGHYANYCTEIPYEETGLAQDLPGRFGSWLKAEVREESPYWKTFYGKIESLVPEEKVVMETQTEEIESTMKTAVGVDNSMALVLVQPEKTKHMSVIRRHNSDQHQTLSISLAGKESLPQNTKKGKAVYKAPTAKKQR